MKLRKLKRQYLEYLEIDRGRSPKTIQNYDRSISKFLTRSGAKKTEGCFPQSCEGIQTLA